MKGLLRKDFALIWYQKIYLLVGVAIMAMASFWLYDNLALGAFGICFIGFLGVNTLVYDEYGEGFSFLMTLPVTRTQFVLSKYISSYIVLASVYILQLLMIFARNQIIGQVKDTEEAVISASAAAIFIVLMISLLIPVTLKFGSEKNSLVVIGGVGIVVAISFIIVKFFGDTPGFNNFIIWLTQLTKGQIIGGVIAFAIITTTISFMISNTIMKKKNL